VRSGYLGEAGAIELLHIASTTLRSVAMATADAWGWVIRQAFAILDPVGDTAATNAFGEGMTDEIWPPPDSAPGIGVGGGRALRHALTDSPLRALDARVDILADAVARSRL
jgi:hypothetical protein